MAEKRRVTFRGFTRGWNPRNAPAKGYVWPYDLGEGELLDAKGLSFTRGGVARLVRNQLMIHPPQADIADTSIGVAKSLLEYRTDSDNQLLAFCKYTTAARLYVLDTPWDTLEADSPTEWDYGAEIFASAEWSHIATTPTLRSHGIADAAQLGDVLFITQQNTSGIHDAPMFWNGTALATVGIDAPASVCTVAEDATADEPEGPDYPAGRYTYFFTYYDAATGQESMPCDIDAATVVPGSHGIPRYVIPGSSVVIAAGSGVDVAGLADHATANYSKRLYRAYTASTDTGTVGETFYLIAEIEGGTLTYEDFDVPPYAVGESYHTDHALPPRGTIVEGHRDRLYMAGLNGGSSSYEDYDSGYWGNVLWWSELSDPFSWPGENMLTVGDDTKITNVVSWRDVLFITKEASCWVLEAPGTTQANLRQVSSRIGCIAQNAIASSPEGVLFAGSEGWYLWDGVRLTEILPMAEQSPWSQWASSTTIDTICYHDGRFYIVQDGYLLMWEPATSRWSYQTVDWEDSEGFMAGVRAYSFSSKQTHVLTRMAWYTMVWPADGTDALLHRYITVLHPSFDFDDVDTDGKIGPDVLHADVSIVFPPLIAPPGMTIRPLRVWVHGSWGTKGGSLQPKMTLSATGITNAWKTTPNAPQGGDVIGVPDGHKGSGSLVSNLAPLWYLKIAGTRADDFYLEAVEVEYLVMPSRGA